MSTYLLVHSAWHGGWYWGRVTPILREAGHDVFTPTLTGLGERAHLLSPEIDLETHIEDILGVLKFGAQYSMLAIMKVEWDSARKFFRSATTRSPEED